MVFKEVVDKIRKVGVSNVQIVSKSNNVADILINSGGSWVTVWSGNRNVAEDVVRQASSKVILG